MSFDTDNTCLDKAKKLVMGDRQDDYGHPLDDFSKITAAAKALGIDPANGGPLHHSLYMVLVKLARLMETPDHADSIVDGPGYFLTYERVLAEQERRANPVDEDVECNAFKKDPPPFIPEEEDPWARNADLLVELAHADDKASLELLRHMYKLNPERFDAEVGIGLSPEERAEVKGNLDF